MPLTEEALDQFIETVRNTVRVQHEELRALDDELSAIMGEDPAGPDPDPDLVSSLRAEIDALEAGNDVLEAALDQVTGERDTARSAAIGLQASIDSMNSQLLAAVQRRDELIGERDALTVERDQLAIDKGNLMAWKMGAEGTMADLENQVATLTEERDELEATRAALFTDRENLLTQVGTLEARIIELEGQLDPDPDPDPPPTGGARFQRLPTGRGTGIIWDPDIADAECRDRMTGFTDPNWQNSAAYVDHTTGIQFTDDGGVIMHMDRAKRSSTPNTGGTNWANVAMPLDDPGQDVELKYRLTLPAHQGSSMKFPGLARITGDQQAPGGGVTGWRQMSVRPTFSDWDRNGSSRSGAYSYFPYTANKGSEKIEPADAVTLWHPARTDQSLWWYGNPNAIHQNGEVVDVSLRCTRLSNGIWKVTQKANGDECVYTYDREPRGQYPDMVSHLNFTVMYGGDNVSYGPDFPTVTRIDDIEIVTHG